MKNNTEKIWRALSRKYQRARNAAEYCRVKAARSRDEAVSKIYADIAVEAEAEADNIWQLHSYYFNRYWTEKFGDASPQEVWDDFCHRRGQFNAAANA